MRFNIDQRNKMIAEMVANIDWCETYDKWLSTKEGSRIDLTTPEELMVWVIIHADRFLATAQESTIISLVMELGLIFAMIKSLILNFLLKYYQSIKKNYESINY